MKIETLTHVPVGTLKPYARNPRTHSKKQIKQIAASIKEFGFTNPILVDADGGVIAGHGRLEAAKILGFETVPTIRLDHMSEAQKRAYIIADNKLALNAGWNEELLAIELQGLLDLDIDFDITLTGFEIPEIDLITGVALGSDDDEADQIPVVEEEPVSKLGDIWVLGRHLLLCGDATKTESYTALMEGNRAQMVFIDPPYNVEIGGHVSGLGKITHREFVMGAGEMSETQFVGFLRSVFERLLENSDDGSIHFVCMDWRHLYELLSAGKIYSTLKNICIWNKTNAGMGSLYRSKHEIVAVYKNRQAAHINNIELGKHGRYRTNVWDYAGVNSLKAERMEELKLHPTVKPVQLVADAILDCSKPNGIVLDSFSGSGTTILAAEKTGRRCFAMELDPLYVDTAIRRWQDFTGKTAIHGDTFSSFNEMTTLRT